MEPLVGSFQKPEYTAMVAILKALVSFVARVLIFTLEFGQIRMNITLVAFEAQLANPKYTYCC